MAPAIPDDIGSRTILGGGGLRAFDVAAEYPVLAPQPQKTRLEAIPAQSAKPLPGVPFHATALLRSILQRGDEPPPDPAVELALLESSGIPDVVHRADGDLGPRLGPKSALPSEARVVEAMDWATSWLREGAGRTDGEPPLPIQNLIRLLLGPPAATQLGLALAESLDLGWLAPGGTWALRLQDPLNIAGIALPPLLELISALGALTGEKIAPETCHLEIEGRKPLSLFQTSLTAYQTEGAEEARTDVRLLLRPIGGSPDRPEQIAPTGFPQMLVSGVDESSSSEQSRHELALATTSARPLGSTVSLRTFHRALRRVLQFAFAKKDFRPGQLEATRRILAGGDCIAALPARSGKSVIYQMAGLLRPGTTVVIEPTNALMRNQAAMLRRSGFSHITQLPSDEAQESASQRDRFLLTTLQSLRKTRTRDHLARLEPSNVSLIVWDEAQSLSVRSSEFRSSHGGLPLSLYDSIGIEFDSTKTPSLALLGTPARPLLRDLTLRLKRKRRPLELVGIPETVPLQVEVQKTKSQLGLQTLTEILASLPKRFGMPAARFYGAEASPPSRGLVFCARRNGPYGLLSVREAIRELGIFSRIGIYSEVCPQGLDPSEFSSTSRSDLSALERGELQLLITTSDIGNGLHIPGLTYTISFGLPESIEALRSQSSRLDTSHSPLAHILVTLPKNQAGDLRLTDSKRSGKSVRFEVARRKGVFGEPDSTVRSLNQHFLAFPEPDKAIQEGLSVWRALESPTNTRPDSRMHRQATLVEIDPSATALEPEAVERALDHLGALGLVRNWWHTPEDTIEIDRTEASPFSLSVEATFWALALEPKDVTRSAEAVLGNLDENFEEQLERALRRHSELLDRTAEPHRRSGIRQVLDCGRKSGSLELSSPEAVPTGSAVETLTSLARNASSESTSWIRFLDGLLITDGLELASAGSDLFGRGRKRPQLAFLAAVGELFAGGDRLRFRELLEAGLAPEEPAGDWLASRQFVDWLVPRVQVLAPDWRAEIWEAWQRAGGPHHLLGRSETLSLADDNQQLEESAVLLSRRLHQACDILDSLKEHYRIDAAEL